MLVPITQHRTSHHTKDITQLLTVFPTLYFVCDIYFATHICFVLHFPHFFLPYIPSSLKPTSLFSVSINCSCFITFNHFFKIPHINEIIQYLSLTSLSISCRSINIITSGKISFFMAEQYFIIYMYI